MYLSRSMPGAKLAGACSRLMSGRGRARNILLLALPQQHSVTRLRRREGGLSIYPLEYIVSGTGQEFAGDRRHRGEQADGLRAVVQRRELAHQSAQGGRRDGLGG